MHWDWILKWASSVSSLKYFGRHSLVSQGENWQNNPPLGENILKSIARQIWKNKFWTFLNMALQKSENKKIKKYIYFFIIIKTQRYISWQILLQLFADHYRQTIVIYVPINTNFTSKKSVEETPFGHVKRVDFAYTKHRSEQSWVTRKRLIYVLLWH